MPRYRKKPVEIEAVQWHQPGDHPAVESECGCDGVNTVCSLCGKHFIQTLEGPHIVTPGDYIIRGVQGEHYPCKPDIFAATYEPVED